MLPNFSLARPQSIGEAVALLSVDDVAYAGGTELLMAMKIGLYKPSKLIDLKRIPELRSITVQDEMLVIGAAATHRQIARDDLVQSHASVLADVENQVGNPRIRSVGTIGGNLCFAEPKSDVLTILMALDAEVVLTSPTGQRSMSIAEFTLGPYTTAREDNELLTYIRLPLNRIQRGTYLKYQTMERPTVGVAAVDSIRDGVSTRTVVVGAVGEIPIRFDFNEEESIDPQEISESVDPIPDLTGSVLYKRHIVSVYVRRVLEKLSEEEPL